MTLPWRDADGILCAATRVIRAGAFAGALTLAGAVAVPGCGPQREGRGTLTVAELVAAAGPTRCGEGRLSLGFGYAPVSGRVPCAAGAGFQGALERFGRGLRSLSPAESCHLRGVLALLAGRPERAVPVLESCVAARPQDSASWNDLAVGRLWLVARGDAPSLYVEALAAADQAIAHDPGATAAGFNRALALSHLHLRSAAAQAWDDCVHRESHAQWVGEARSRLARERRPSYAERWTRAREELVAAARRGDAARIELAVEEFSQPLQDLAQEELLPAWAERAAADDEKGALQALKAAAAIGAALAERRGERLIWAEAEAIEHSSSNPERRSELIKGHRRLRAARVAFLHADLAQAAVLARQGGESLRRGKSPAALLALQQLASCDYQRGRSGRSEEHLRQLLARREVQVFASLAGRIHWLIGLCQLAAGQPVSALHSYGEALARFERLGAAEDIANAHSLMAEALTYLGDRRSAWEHRYAALAGSDLTVGSRHLFNIWEGAALAVATDGNLPQALTFRDEVVRVARSDPDPQGVSFALGRRAEILFRLGQATLAGRDLAAARIEAARIGDRAAREWQEAIIAAAEGMSWIRATPAAALRPLSQALAYHRRHGNRFFTVSLSFARARAERSLGMPEAERDLEAGLVEMEREREAIPDETLRASYFEQAETALEDAVRLRWARGETAAALSYHERARARVLLDRLRPEGASTRSTGLATAMPLTAEALRAGIPPGVAVIEYAALADRLLIWIVRHEGIDTLARPVGAAELEAKALRLRGDLEGTAGSDEIGAATASLSEEILAPLAGRLRRGELLVLVPDRSLESVPFAMLRTRGGQGFLIESYRLVVAPSASYYVRSLVRWRQLSREPSDRALVVGDPAFDRRLFPSAPRLPDAASEAVQVASLYPGSELLLDRGATPERLAAMAGAYQVLHLAAHTFVDGEHPLFSRLAMAPSSTGTGVLYGYQVQRLALGRTRLVVLAGCESGSGPTAGREGVMSLARFFMAAGAPTVVASLWNVDDAVTARIMLAFHRAFRAGGDAAAALRDVQVHLLRDGDPTLRSPRAWAAFVPIGAVGP